MTIRLAVVDDSTFVRKAIARMMQSESDVEIAGLAASGEELLEHLDDWNPTAITLDLSMPGLGGLATLDRILAWRNVPVVILSGHSTRDAPLAVEALSRGAADFVDKQEFSLVDFQGLRAAILEKLRALRSAGVPPAAIERPARSPVWSPGETPTDCGRDARAPALILIGASTGGPPAIERILEDLDTPPVPIVIVQHMPAGFTTAFADRLNNRMPFPVEEVTHNRELVAGRVYIAPAGNHVRVRMRGNQLLASLAQFPETQHRPSIDVLFRSAAALGSRLVAVLLTGMGDDGAQGLAELRERGALTIAQDEASSIVYGMPRAAVELGAVCEQLPLRDISARLRNVLA
jgi:two-component system chemotaxis response regulator CheB